jgi:hypothetical protein
MSFYNKLLNTQYNLLNSYFQKTQPTQPTVQYKLFILWSQVGAVAYYPYIALLRNDQNSKFHVCFPLHTYCFFMIMKLNNYKSNHSKMGQLVSLFYDISFNLWSGDCISFSPKFYINLTLSFLFFPKTFLFYQKQLLYTLRGLN